jgi:hypothetical protein
MNIPKLSDLDKKGIIQGKMRDDFIGINKTIRLKIFISDQMKMKHKNKITDLYDTNIRLINLTGEDINIKNEKIKLLEIEKNKKLAEIDDIISNNVNYYLGLISKDLMNENCTTCGIDNKNIPMLINDKNLINREICNNVKTLECQLKEIQKSEPMEIDCIYEDNYESCFNKFIKGLKNVDCNKDYQMCKKIDLKNIEFNIKQVVHSEINKDSNFVMSSNMMGPEYLMSATNDKNICLESVPNMFIDRNKFYMEKINLDDNDKDKYIFVIKYIYPSSTSNSDGSYPNITKYVGYSDDLPCKCTNNMDYCTSNFKGIVLIDKNPEISITDDINIIKFKPEITNDK